MPGRRVPLTRPSSQPSRDEDDMHFMLSQGSSDDHGNETFAAVASEFKATWEKKMRGRDDRIIQTTQKELDVALQTNEIEITHIINDITNIHQDFLENYAILEDRKRKIMATVTEKQEELIPLAVMRHQAAINLGHEVENGQLEGMVLIKGTCQRLQNVAQELSTLRLDC